VGVAGGPWPGLGVVLGRSVDRGVGAAVRGVGVALGGLLRVGVGCGVTTVLAGACVSAGSVASGICGVSPGLSVDVATGCAVEDAAGAVSVTGRMSVGIARSVGVAEAVGLGVGVAEAVGLGVGAAVAVTDAPSFVGVGLGLGV